MQGYMMIDDVVYQEPITNAIHYRDDIIAMIHITTSFTSSSATVMKM